MCIGIVALLTGKTAEIITLSVFGALSLYVISMISLIRLRQIEPQLERPFKTPFYPYFPLVALVIALISLIALTVYNPYLALIYFLILGFSYLLFVIFRKKTVANNS